MSEKRGGAGGGGGEESVKERWERERALVTDKVGRRVREKAVCTTD